MDEFAFFKGHRYTTVIVDAMSYQVIWSGLGSKDMRPFFERLGKGVKNIEAVAMDMNRAFDIEVQQHRPPLVLYMTYSMLLLNLVEMWWIECESTKLIV